MSATMLAVLLDRHGGPEELVVGEVPRPVPGPGEVRVRVAAASVNHIDLDVRAGRSRLPHPLPLVLGREATGTVDAVGSDVQGLAQGDPVLVLPQYPCGRCEPCGEGCDNLCLEPRRPGVTHWGGYAQYTVGPADGMIRLPAGAPLDRLAAAAVSYGTAWRILTTLAVLRPGERVLVTGAAGGLGTAVVQVATHLGAEVVGAVGSPAKADHVLRQGARWAVDYADGAFADEVLELTGGVDIAVDHIGGGLLQEALDCLARRGRLVVAGGHAGERPPVDVITLFRRELRILGCASYTRRELAAVLEFVSAGDLDPQIHEVLPLERAADAHRLLEGREVRGKLLLRP